MYYKLLKGIYGEQCLNNVVFIFFSQAREFKRKGVEKTTHYSAKTTFPLKNTTESIFQRNSKLSKNLFFNICCMIIINLSVYLNIKI